MTFDDFRVAPECFPCFLKQVIISLNQTGLESHEKIGIIKSILKDIQETDISESPAHSTTFMHRRIRQLLGTDPFKDIKKRYNQIGLSLYEELKEIVKGSPDPLLTATRLAIAGNSIDFGIYSTVDIEAEIRRALKEDLAWDDYGKFRASLEGAESLLYLLDNAGEIVFDRILIEELVERGISVRAVVKGSPVINDATLEDALQTGIDRVSEVITNGSDCIGTILKWCSKEFQEVYNNSSLIISKGQGNFETLCHEERQIFFLFQSKCEVVSRFIGVKPGSMMLIQGGSE